MHRQAAGWRVSRTRNWALVAATAARNSGGVKAAVGQHQHVSVPAGAAACGRRRSRRGARGRTPRRAAPGCRSPPGSSARSPGSRSPRARPSACPARPGCRLVSGTLTEAQPSKATVRYRPNTHPRAHDGWASGPASTSNSSLQRRRHRDAGAGPAAPSADGHGQAQARPAPAVSWSATPAGSPAPGTGPAPARSTPRPATAAPAAAAPAPGSPPAPHRPARTARLPGQLTQVARSEHPRSHRDRPGNQS